jgi:hypothetical protein
MRIALVCIQEHQGQFESLDQSVPRYTGRPVTLGLTLPVACITDSGISRKCRWEYQFHLHVFAIASDNKESRRTLASTAKLSERHRKLSE